MDVMMELPHTSSQGYFSDVHTDSKVIVCLFTVFKCFLLIDETISLLESLTILILSHKQHEL